MGDAVERMPMAGAGRIEALLAQIELLIGRARPADVAASADGHHVASVAHHQRMRRRQTRRRFTKIFKINF